MDRHRRILRAAAEQGALHGFDRVQMQEIAKDAGVAIGTLYRYFPSKTHLFTAVLRTQVHRLDQITPRAGSDTHPADAVADVLVEATRRLLERPLLAQAMLQSNNAAVARSKADDAVTRAFLDLILRVGGVDNPSPLDERLVRLAEQTWYGVLVSSLNDHISVSEAEEDTRLGCRLLLANLTRSAQ